MANVIDLEKLENLKPDSNGWVAACPLCRAEGRDRTGVHLKIYPDGAFGCVVNQKDRAHNAGILQLVGTESDGTLTHYSAPAQEPKLKIERFWDISILDKLIKDYSYFESRGISAATQMYFRMGVATTATMKGRVVIPIFNERKDKIIGFSGRLLQKHTQWHKEHGVPKWKHLNPSSEFIFCGDEKTIPNNSILITEGPADVLALYEAGIKNTLCLFGTTISSKQLAFLIKNNPKKIVVGLNNEPDNKNIGLEAAKKLEKTLLNYFNEEKVVIGLPEGEKDFNDLLEKDKNLLASYREKWLS